MNEYIKAAAIKWRRKGEQKAEICWGPNHAYCIEWFSCAGIYSSERDTEFEQQGFITTTGRFVDRVEALEIARREGQLKYDNYDRGILYSEFVNYRT